MPAGTGATAAPCPTRGDCLRRSGVVVPYCVAVAAHTVYQRETEVRWAWRGIGGWWWLGLLLGPLLVAGLVGAFGVVSGQLATEARSALERDDLSGISVSLHGRDAAVTPAAGANPSVDELERAAVRVEQVPGVRTATVGEHEGPGLPLLLAELWALALVAFAVGAAVTWAVGAIALPDEDTLEAETGTASTGLLPWGEGR